MAEFSRHVDVTWQGSIMDGKGVIDAGTGAFHLPVTFPQRIGDAGGGTSPEELMAAAHGTCFAMVVTGAIGRAKASAQKISVTCTVTADKGDAGIKITTSKLVVVAHGLTGMDANAFAAMAKDAEGKCPVSNALRASMAIEVDAKVA